jgi:hypothetical protein
LAVPDRNKALLYYAGAALLVLLGVATAAVRFPGGFDWAYTVISRLGSHRHNPDGAVWLAASLLGGVALLWPVAGHLSRAYAASPRPPRVSPTALRGGLVGGAILGIEGLFALEFSRLARKAHEIVALLTFLGLYWGVLGLYLHRIRQSASFLWPALLVVGPLLAVGISQLALYFGQRDLGWVNTDWRDMGVPVWLSFAFWQWLAVAFLGIGIGVLVLASGRDGGGRSPVSQSVAVAKNVAAEAPPAT